jgi:predicted kinase
MANDTTNLIKSDEVEEVYREWIKTYNGGDKEDKEDNEKETEEEYRKRKEYWEKIRRIGEKRVDHRKNYEEYLKRTEN